MKNETKVRCNNCMTTYTETPDQQVTECKKCKTGSYLMTDFIETKHNPLNNVCILQKYADSDRVLELRKEFEESKQFIEMACNSHEELVKCLKRVLACGFDMPIQLKQDIEQALEKAGG